VPASLVVDLSPLEAMVTRALAAAGSHRLLARSVTMASLLDMTEDAFETLYLENASLRILAIGTKVLRWPPLKVLEWMAYLNDPAALSRANEEATCEIAKRKHASHKSAPRATANRKRRARASAKAASPAAQGDDDAAE